MIVKYFVDSFLLLSIIKVYRDKINCGSFSFGIILILRVITQLITKRLVNAEIIISICDFVTLLNQQSIHFSDSPEFIV